MSSQPLEERIFPAECNHASDCCNATEAHPRHLAASGLTLAFILRLEENFHRKRNPSYVRDTVTPSREETSVLKRKSTRKPLKSYPWHLATLSKTFLDKVTSF